MNEKKSWNLTNERRWVSWWKELHRWQFLPDQVISSTNCLLPASSLQLFIRQPGRRLHKKPNGRFSTLARIACHRFSFLTNWIILFSDTQVPPGGLGVVCSCETRTFWKGNSTGRCYGSVVADKQGSGDRWYHNNDRCIIKRAKLNKMRPFNLQISLCRYFDGKLHVLNLVDFHLWTHQSIALDLLYPKFCGLDLIREAVRLQTAVHYSKKQKRALTPACSFRNNQRTLGPIDSYSIAKL